MKKITCEACGGNDLIKQDNVFVCQFCGMKYSVESIKKMMIEGTVDVTGSTIKVDTSAELENLYQIARRAKENNDYEGASRYYDMILVKDPTSWEASFYSVYFRALECKVAQIRSAGISVCNCIDTTLKLLKNNVEVKENQIAAIQEIALRCTALAKMLYDSTTQHNIGGQTMIDNYCTARNVMYILGNNIDTIFGDYEELHPVTVSAWKDGIDRHAFILRFCHKKEEQESNKNTILNYVSKVQKYDSSYQAPASCTSTSSGGCYVATCVYGSYDCPQVWTLRRYRDYTLAETWYGRAFIHTYYAISPTLVKWFGHTEWFKKMWKGKLDRMVKKLQSEGVESTPYTDKKY